MRIGEIDMNEEKHESSYIALLNSDMAEYKLYAKKEDGVVGIYYDQDILVHVADNETGAHSFLQGIQYAARGQGGE